MTELGWPWSGGREVGPVTEVGWLRSNGARPWLGRMLAARMGWRGERGRAISPAGMKEGEREAGRPVPRGLKKSGWVLGRKEVEGAHGLG